MAEGRIDEQMITHDNFLPIFLSLLTYIFLCYLLGELLPEKGNTTSALIFGVRGYSRKKPVNHAKKEN